MNRQHKPSQCGFTLVELVTVIIILGILAVVALPRFADRTAFVQRGFTDEMRATLRYAQKAAIAKRRAVCVGFSSGQIALQFNPTETASSTCSSPLNLPGQSGPSAHILGAPTGFTIAGTDFSFSALGRPSSGISVTLTAPDTTQTTLTITQETGYVL